jgi:hypothetical protein
MTIPEATLSKKYWYSLIAALSKSKSTSGIELYYFDQKNAIHPLIQAEGSSYFLDFENFSSRNCTWKKSKV